MAAIVLFPLIFLVLFTILVAIPQTRPAAFLLTKENQPVELATFAFLLWAGLAGVGLALRAKYQGEAIGVYGFYGAFALGALFVGMEEIAWGQWFFAFETPEIIKQINMQKEMTLHNIEGLQGHSEFFRVAFGVGGLMGVALGHYAPFRRIGAPAVLLTYFLPIAALALLDLYEDHFPIQQNVDFFIRRLSEVVEMLIAISALLYVWLNGKRLAKQWSERLYAVAPT